MEVKEIRERLGLPQQAMAVNLGVSVGTISRWERGTVSPNKTQREKLARLERWIGNSKD